MGVMPGLQLCRVGSNGARRMYSTRGVLRVSRVLLNSFRTEIPREEEQSHRQADGRAEAEGVLRAHHAQDDYGNYPPQRRSSGIWGYLKVFIAGLGWVLFIGTLSRMSFMYSFLDFLDVAFPRKLHALRLCFDLLPPDQKMELVSEFRKQQRNGYGDSLFEYLLEFHPEVMTAQGLTPFETLRRLNFISNLVFEAGEVTDMNWREMVSAHAQKHNLPQDERLGNILNKAGGVFQDDRGLPLYPGQALFGEMYEERKDSIRTYPTEETTAELSANSKPKPGWRLL